MKRHQLNQAAKAIEKEVLDAKDSYNQVVIDGQRKLNKNTAKENEG